MTQESALYTMKTGANVFLTGAPGSGKTHTLNQYLNHLKKYGIQAAITAPTGIAASHIGGMTLHSFFGLGIKETLSQYDIENLLEKKYLWDRMKDLKVLVIDEVSMLSPEVFESIDSLLRHFKFSTEAFGGVQVILVGDFFQLPPISKIKKEKKFIFQTEVWQELNLQTCYLSTSHRHEDEILLGILNEIRSGSVSENSMEHFRSRYKKTPEGTSSITKLYTHNTDVDSINIAELKKINEPIKKYQAHTTGAKKWLDRIFSSSLVLDEVQLKKGALVFFIKNNHEKGYINGTLGTVVDFDVFGIPIIQTHDGREIKAERMEWTFSDENGQAKATIKQIPLRLAWAITIHKSQGMTLQAAEIDLSRAFEPGQGYVALSRITKLSGLRLMGLNDIALQIDENVLNVDTYMKTQSCSIHESFENLSSTEKEKNINEYIQCLGGSLEKGEIKKNQEKERKPKTKSFLESKPFFSDQKSIAEIAKERDLTEATIFKHLAEIIKDDNEFDISYLQPPANIIESVGLAIKEIQNTNSKKDFLENGDVKLKAIFQKLNEKVSYDQIKLSILFLE